MENELSPIERKVLESFKKLDRPIGEDEYHTISQVMDFSGHGLGFGYDVIDWKQLDSRYVSTLPGGFFSSELHDVINNLINRGFLYRDPENPIRIFAEKFEVEYDKN